MSGQNEAVVADPKLITPFANSVRKVLETMAGLEATVEVAPPERGVGNDYEYSAIIGFSGGVAGTMVLRLHQATAIGLVNAFAGEGIEPDSGDFVDAIGELSNMFAGAAKAEMPGTANISVPSVVVGKGHVICRRSDIPRAVLGCETSKGKFALEISIKSA